MQATTVQGNPAAIDKAALKEQIQAAIEAARAAAQDAANQNDAHISINGRRIDGRNDIPPGAVDISIAFFVCSAIMVVGFPIARALGRRIDRKGQVATVSPQLTDQLQRIEQAVDTMAIEIERISESQRFMAKLQNADVAERALK